MAISAFCRDLRSLVGTRLLPMPAVAAIIRDADGCILCQQQHDDRWSLPAGAIEPGETPAQAVVCEVHEETGLVVRPSRLAGVLGGRSCRVTYPNVDEVEYTVVVFECTAVGGALLGSAEETTRLEHFMPDALPPFGFSYPGELFRSARGSANFGGADMWASHDHSSRTE